MGTVIRNTDPKQWPGPENLTTNLSTNSVDIFVDKTVDRVCQCWTTTNLSTKKLSTNGKRWTTTNLSTKQLSTNAKRWTITNLSTKNLSTNEKRWTTTNLSTNLLLVVGQFRVLQQIHCRQIQESVDKSRSVDKSKFVQQIHCRQICCSRNLSTNWICRQICW